jgi:hypothetical protein
LEWSDCHESLLRFNDFVVMAFGFGLVNLLMEIEIGDLYEDGAKIVLMMAVVMEDCGGYGRLW